MFKPFLFYVLIFVFTSLPSFATTLDYRSPIAMGRFDGTNTGTFAIDAGFGVSAITRLSQGYYEVLLSNTMANTNYIILVSSESTPTNDTNLNVMIEYGSITTDSFQIKTGSTHGAQGDSPSVHFVIYGEVL